MSDTEDDTTMIDANGEDDIDEDAANETKMMYGHGTMTEHELDEKFPNRPKNKHKTLPFAELYLTLFNPLQDNKKKPGRAPVNQKKIGPRAMTPREIKNSIIDRFIDRWRKEVGPDIFPAIRLIIPEKDRDRGMYGLKEATIAKLLVKIMKIDGKKTEDGYNLIHWKLPGFKASSVMAGDFAGRCYEVISKRPMLTKPGTMTVAEVNEMLDRLSVATKEESQLPILEAFYNRMCADELMWLIRMVLRQMKVGATEKTILERWHPDAEHLFNITSSLRRVCWELYDPEVRLEGDNKNITLMQCFQPQLAGFQGRTMEQMVARMKPTEKDDVFWIEEKLDGERMQLHMVDDDEIPGGKRFGFWSRKAKDYTSLYGTGLQDTTGSLTKHMQGAFGEGVRSIILDGEMITWNMDHDRIYPFGHLKTAALEEQKTQISYSGGNRPLFRIFDCLLLNGKDLTRYTLRDRRKALEASVTDVPRRFEMHKYDEARDAAEIEPKLRAVIAERGEGLVLKNPRSSYRLNDRNDDWMKVKPEYMQEFGESLDCVVIGAYYGSGKRGGNHSSYLCGLRVSQEEIDHKGADPQKCYSFFKVGGGFSAADYAEMRHRTDGKWKDWDLKNPPNEMIVLGGSEPKGRERHFERPDQIIRPEDSVVIEAKAASVGSSDQFGYGATLRFPRFKRLRTDKTWEQALSVTEFKELRGKVEHEVEEKKFKVDDARKKRSTGKRKREIKIQGQDDDHFVVPYAGPATKVFEGMSFSIMTEALKPLKKSKLEIEALVKANGGTVVASEKDPDTICVADRNLVKVASVQKRGERHIVRPRWLYDAVAQSEADLGRPGFHLPLEPQRHIYAMKPEEEIGQDAVDEHGDSYCRDINTEELGELLEKMRTDTEDDDDADLLIEQLAGRNSDLDNLRGWMFRGLTGWFGNADPDAARLFGFAGGTIAASLDDDAITHVVLGDSLDVCRDVKANLVGRRKLPRLVTAEWVAESWKEKTRLDEERFVA